MEHSLSYLDDKERLKIYEALTSGCKHLWSKNKLQEEKFAPIWQNFGVLAELDPKFLAHFTSYAVRKLEDKDLKVLATLASTLSDADGTPFEPGSKYNKPNWRTVGQAAVQALDPKLVLRVLKLSHEKHAFGSKAKASHFSKSLATAVTKYLRYREANPKALEGVVKAGLGNTYKKLYRLSHTSPSPEACKILRWPQKAGYPGAGVELNKSLFDFTGLDDLGIAEKIRAEKIPPTTALGALPGKISPVIAAAVLEQASGDQTVILTELFESQGLLKNAQVKEVYSQKIRTAKNALDRVERIKADLAVDVRQDLEAAKSAKRKEDVGDLGKVFVHIDISGSMEVALKIAKDRSAVIAECIQNPDENFHWGTFREFGKILPKPQTFEKAAFAAALYGERAGGGTNCLALYEEARRRGCTTDVYITDQGHTGGPLDYMLSQAQARGLAKPNLVIIIDVNGRKTGPLAAAFERFNVPVVVLDPTQLVESALVSQAVKVAFKGQAALIEEILKEPLLELPKWWGSVLKKA